ncbi:hypothetical protein F4818DRAFT_417289 [Hypoxylon cercidicola]|nr:hypothetical protein F4818DRAFT_417289 [Hypoxylon cercidicola]
MAEAIATLSLVCNVMQVVSFTSELITLYRNAKDGSPEPNLASNTAHFSALVSELENRAREFDPIYSGNDDMRNGIESSRQLAARNRLKTVGADLARDTKELQTLLQKVAVTASSGRLRRFTVAMKYKFRYQAPISSLKKRIDETRDMMNLELLNGVCSSTQACCCRSEEIYARLGDDIKRFIDRWSEGERTMSELVSREAQNTRDHITAEAEQTREQIIAESSRRGLEQTRERILESLWFPEMNQRGNKLEEVSDDISREIFPRSEFVGWLRSDKPVFWFNGKPGSGKSTLVKHLSHSSQTLEHLQAWKPSVQIFRFYFYELGLNPLQRQLLGCLRTLLRQILDSDPDVLEFLLESHPQIGTKMSEHDWSLKELLDILPTCLRHKASASCILIDGLDEIQAHEKVNIIDLVYSLGSIPHVKICVASRPENPFTQHLDSCPSIRVQDITSVAIHSYANQTLRKQEETLRKYRDSLETFEVDFQYFIERLTWKSEGVFLWAAMAVNSLVRGLGNADSWKDLNQRVEEFAPSLNELYEQMWYKQNADLSIYKIQAAELFSHALYSPMFCKTILNYLLETHEDLRAQLQHLMTSNGRLTSSDEIHVVRQFRTWLWARSAGLLETKDSVKNSWPFVPEIATEVDFIHRSVREFLQGTTEGQQIMSHDKRSTEAKYLAYADAAKEATYIYAVIYSSQVEPAKKYVSTFFQSDYSIAMTIPVRPGLDMVGKSRCKEWMPRHHNHNQTWSLRFLTMIASAGDIVTLDYIDQTFGTFQRASPREKSEILLYCCQYVSLEYLKGRRLYMFMTREQSLEMMTKVQGQKICCIEWLLKHGSDPDMCHKEENMDRSWRGVIQNTLSYRTMARDYDFGVHGRSAFAMFLVQEVLNLASVHQEYQHPNALITGWGTDIRKCVKLFDENRGDNRHEWLSIVYHPLHPAREIVIDFQLNTTWLSEVISRTADSSTSVAIPASFGNCEKSEVIRVVAVKSAARFPWRQPATGNKVEDIMKLENLIGKALFGAALLTRTMPKPDEDSLAEWTLLRNTTANEINSVAEALVWVKVKG